MHNLSIRVLKKINGLKIITAFLLLAVVTAGFLPAQSPSSADVSILFTHDMHSHFEAERCVIDGEPDERGGFARMKFIINVVKVLNPNTFLIDGGDFAMGTPFQTIYSSEASELRMMGLLGFDATTLGNHEFDYRTQGLTDMLNTAISSGERLPFIVTSNIDWERTLTDEKRASKAADLQKALNRYGAAEYTVIEKGGVKAAIFGILGKQADSYAPLSGLYFKDQIEASKKIVAKIKAETSADIIICLSHSGTDDNPQKSEDEILAAAVPEIDVIISGHTHSTLEKPIIVGNTIIVSCGEYTHNIGQLLLTRNGSRYTLLGYNLLHIAGILLKAPDVEAAIQKFKSLVDKNYFSRFGYSYDQVISYTDFDFIPVENFGKVQGEDTLGNLISDSYIASIKKAEGANYRKIDVAVVPSGVVRGSFSKGPITTADAFNVSSLGIGPDMIPGYPLVNIYLTGKELKTVAEIDASVSTLMSEARLYTSGLTYTYNPHRLLLNRVTDVKLMNPDGSFSKLKNKKLYRVIGGLYSCQMLGAVEAHSFGLLKVQPKDENGNPITDFEKHIIYNGDTELKEWVALADYLESFDKSDGVSKIPVYYNQLHGRKIEVTSRAPWAILKKPNKIFFMLLGVIIVVLAIIATPVFFIVRAVRRRKRS